MGSELQGEDYGAGHRPCSHARSVLPRQRSPSEGGRWRELPRGESAVKAEGLVVETAEVAGGVHLGLVSTDPGLPHGGLTGGEAVLRCRGAWGSSSPTSHSLLRPWAGSAVSTEPHACPAGRPPGFVLSGVVLAWHSRGKCPAAGPRGGHEAATSRSGLGDV